jgi:addiction module HigA family antidote
MKIKNPIHLGQILKHDVLPELGMTITQAAAALGVSRSALSRLLNGRAAISAKLAQRLGQWLGSGAEAWLRMQAAHDNWQAARPIRPGATPQRKAVKKTRLRSSVRQLPNPSPAASALLRPLCATPPGARASAKRCETRPGIDDLPIRRPFKPAG